MTGSLEIGAVVRPTADDLPAGVYRVVGTGEATVTVLRIGDADGRRVHTGELHADANPSGFEPVADPPSRSAAAAAVRIPATVYWSVRAFLRQLRLHPGPAAVAIVVLLVGEYADWTALLPDVASGVLIIVGALGLAYVGSGRFAG